MAGFKNEKEVWAFQKPRLVGKWDRYELMTPAGHPDVKGSYRFEIFYIENKIGAPSYHALEESQKEYLKWLVDCGQHVYICFGGAATKNVQFFELDAGTFKAPNHFWTPTVPLFWRP